VRNNKRIDISYRTVPPYCRSFVKWTP